MENDTGLLQALLGNFPFYPVLDGAESNQRLCHLAPDQCPVQRNERALKPIPPPNMAKLSHKTMHKHSGFSVYITPFHSETTCAAETGHSSIPPPTPSVYIECFFWSDWFLIGRFISSLTVVRFFTVGKTPHSSVGKTPWPSRKSTLLPHSPSRLWGERNLC